MMSDLLGLLCHALFRRDCELVDELVVHAIGYQGNFECSETWPRQGV
jgi:hypothetical protein